MILVFNNTNGCPTKGLQKEELGLMDVCYICFVQQKQMLPVYYYTTFITIVTVNNKHCPTMKWDALWSSEIPYIELLQPKGGRTSDRDALQEPPALEHMTSKGPFQCQHSVIE